MFVRTSPHSDWLGLWVVQGRFEGPLIVWQDREESVSQPAQRQPTERTGSAIGFSCRSEP